MAKKKLGDKVVFASGYGSAYYGSTPCQYCSRRAVVSAHGMVWCEAHVPGAAGIGASPAPLAPDDQNKIQQDPMFDQDYADYKKKALLIAIGVASAPAAAQDGNTFYDAGSNQTLIWMNGKWQPITITQVGQPGGTATVVGVKTPLYDTVGLQGVYASAPATADVGPLETTRSAPGPRKGPICDERPVLELDDGRPIKSNMREQVVEDAVKRCSTLELDEIVNVSSRRRRKCDVDEDAKIRAQGLELD